MFESHSLWSMHTDLLAVALTLVPIARMGVLPSFGHRKRQRCRLRA